MGSTKTHNFKLHDLNGVHELSHLLAQYFPEPQEYVTGIYELLLNAVEHGNLGIGYEAKGELIRDGKWREEIARRLVKPENVDKEVNVTLAYNNSQCKLTIADQGQGFAWQNFINRPPPKREYNGRGLLIALSSKFDFIKFNKAGNEVTCLVKYLNEPKS